MNKNFWNKNKVLILGVLSAIAIALQPIIAGKSITWPTVGIAAGLAVLSFFAKEWRGQGMSILGIVGIAAQVIHTQISEGTFSWQRAAVSIFVAIVFAVAPDPKSRGYENTAIIKEAKKQGEAINPAQLTAKPK